MAADTADVKTFLRRSLYRHPQVVETTDAAKTVVRELFQAYASRPDELPTRHAAGLPAPLAISDYIAGMTDRYALREHARLFGAGASPLTRGI